MPCLIAVFAASFLRFIFDVEAITLDFTADTPRRLLFFFFFFF